MLKRNITYEDFNGDTCTEVFYFNISKPEIVELQYSETDGFSETLQKIIKNNDQGALISVFKRLVLDSYGQKSVDGKRFIKTPQLREEFSQMAAYHSLFMELAQNDNAAAEFVIGVFPKDMSGELEKSLQTSDAIIKRAEGTTAVTSETMIKEAVENALPAPQQPYPAG